jgi:hypothetical protein
MLARYTTRCERLVPVAALVVLLVLMVACRGATLASAATLNPDEAELLAAGRRAALNLSPYVTYTTPTYLFLWPLSLGLLAHAGLPMTLQAAHVLSGLGYVLMAFVGWLLLSRYYGWLLSAVLVLPTALAVFAGPASDFLSLGTELLPISILLAAAVVLLPPERLPSMRRLAVGCAIAGTTLWAKPQLAVLALALCVVGLLMRRLPGEPPDRGGRAPTVVRDLAVAVVAFAAPSVLILLLMAVQGTLPAFVDEPLAVILGYAAQHATTGTGTTPVSAIARLQELGVTLRVSWSAFLWALPGIAVLSGIRRSARPWEHVVGETIWLLPVAAAVVTLLATYPMYLHYGNIVFAGCLLSGIAGTAAARLIRTQEGTLTQPGRPRGISAKVSAAAIGAIVLSIAFVFPGIAEVRSNVADVMQGPWAAGGTTPPRAPEVASLCPPGSRVLVWGWASELYAEYDWLPASRYVTPWPLSSWGHPGRYRATLLAEVNRQPPGCVVEAIGPGSGYFGALGPSDAISVRMPDLAAYLESCYVNFREQVPGMYQKQLQGTAFVNLWRWSGNCPKP